MLVALIVPTFLVQQYPIFKDNHAYNHLITATLIAIIVVFGIWYLRSRLDKGTPSKIGLTKLPTAITHIFIGIGFVLIPLVLTLLISTSFNWADFSFNANKTILLTFLIGLVSTFFTDALSEELIFRGYIFSNLNEHYNILKSSLITLVVFVITPIIIITIQNTLSISGSVPLSGGYVITLIFFGAFMQYLRVIFKSIWVGVGFHLVFVHMNQLMGTTSDKLLQFSETSNQQPVQITLAILLIIVFLSLIIYPLLKRRKIKKLEAETLSQQTDN